MDKPNITDWISALSALLGMILAGLLIPYTINESQKQSTASNERENRKVGIAQILSGEYDEECSQRLSTNRLINELFDDLDDSDKFAIIQYIRECNPGQDVTIKSEVQQEIIALQNEIISANNVEEILKVYTIDIHYLDSDTSLEQEAESIRQKLIEEGLDANKIELTSLSQAKLLSLGGLSDDQIRFERDIEAQAAAALQQLLDRTYPQKKFRLQTIRGSTPKYISIFIKS